MPETMQFELSNNGARKLEALCYKTNIEKPETLIQYALSVYEKLLELQTDMKIQVDLPDGAVIVPLMPDIQPSNIKTK